MSDPIPPVEPIASDTLSLMEERIDQVHAALIGEGGDDLSSVIADWATGDIAAILEALSISERRRFWSSVSEKQRGDVLARLGEQVRATLLDSLQIEDAVAATSSMNTPDLAEVVDEASAELREAILESLKNDDRAQVEEALTFPEDSAGRLMEREWVAVRADVRLDVIKRYLHARGSLPPKSSTLMVVDREGIFLGKLSLAALLTKNPELMVEEVMNSSAITVNVSTPLSEVAHLFERRDLVSLPVLDDMGKLVGRIILDDAFNLIRNEAEQPMMHMAGLEVDEDLLAPIAASARRRMVWLGINLATAFLAAWVIGLFEATLDKIVALAVLMPIVASMGGIAGSQTLTLAIRGLALGQITSANTRWLAIKEITIAAINGIVWAIVVGVITWLWFGQIGIAFILAVAMIVNMLTAAASGLAIPLILERMGLDPALAGSVILTTVSDVVGFMSFLGLATLFLL